MSDIDSLRFFLLGFSTGTLFFTLVVYFIIGGRK